VFFFACEMPLRTIRTNGRNVKVGLEFKTSAAPVDLIRSKQVIDVRFTDMGIDGSARGLVNCTNKYFAIHLFNNDVGETMGTFDDTFHFYSFCRQGKQILK
jgi:hypothetical protein